MTAEKIGSKRVARALEQAINLHQQGRLIDAERLYRQVLASHPQDFDALHLLGMLKLQLVQPEDALRLFRSALNVDATSAAAHSNCGLSLAALGRYEEALESYDRALAIRPRDADALANRADALCDLGRVREALPNYEQAISINPRLVSALVNRGIALCDLGRTGEALESYDRALAVDPDDAVAWNNRGVALQDLDRPAESLACYERALVLQPDYVEALLNRGNALLTLKRPAEALSSYARAIALRPNSPDGYCNRGHALCDLERFEDALASYDKTLALKPDHFEALFQRARALAKLGRLEDALAELQGLRRSQPDFPRLLNDLVDFATTACRWPETAALGRDLIDGSATRGSIADPFVLLRLDCEPEQQLAGARSWLRHKKVSAVQRAWTRSEFPTDRIRVAYLSADFHRHATAHLIADLIEVHDRTRFEIVGISFGPDDRSDMRSRLAKSFDRFFDVRSRSDDEAAGLIRDLKTQIAVDLKGHTTDARIGILAQRPAPIQASYLGYPGTTGADFIDYVIADRIVLPLEQQPFYSERIVQLPENYQVNGRRERNVSAPPARSAVGLPDDGFVFCCFNNGWKITARMFDVWMRLLGAVDGSILWLFRANDFACANLRNEAQARGIDPARLVFAPPVDLADHLARIALADLFLDTLPYNAHTTGSDALWAGVPVVTYAGSTFAGRVGASLLTAVGLPTLATHSFDEYEALAMQLARDPTRLMSIRAKLRQDRETCPLFDTDRFRRHIEAAYTRMWEIWMRGESPQSFSIDAIDGTKG